MRPYLEKRPKSKDVGWYVLNGDVHLQRGRDNYSGETAAANMAILEHRLAALSPEGTGWETIRERNPFTGWEEVIMIDPDGPAAVLCLVEATLDALDTYPLLDDAICLDCGGDTMAPHLEEYGIEPCECVSCPECGETEACSHDPAETKIGDAEHAIDLDSLEEDGRIWLVIPEGCTASGVFVGGRAEENALREADDEERAEILRWVARADFLR